MDREQEIRSIIDPLLDELSAIQEEKKRKEELSLLGKCFKFHNSYHSLETDSDPWWVYRKITGFNDGSLSSTSFQIDPEGNVDVRFDERLFSITPKWQEISEAEYQSAWADFLYVLYRIKP